jgi:hypothetical protein
MLLPKFFLGPPNKFLHAKRCYFAEDNVPIDVVDEVPESMCTFECRLNPLCTHYHFVLGHCELFQGTAEKIQICPSPACNCGIDCDKNNTVSELCDDSKAAYMYTMNSVEEQPIWATTKKTIFLSEGNII